MDMSFSIKHFSNQEAWTLLENFRELWTCRCWSQTGAGLGMDLRAMIKFRPFLTSWKVARTARCPHNIGLSTCTSQPPGSQQLVWLCLTKGFSVTRARPDWAHNSESLWTEWLVHIYSPADSFRWPQRSFLQKTLHKNQFPLSNICY